MNKISRLDATDKAKELIKELAHEHGELMFYQSGGCCEGTQPMCFNKGGFYLRRGDVKIGEILNYEFWIDRDLFKYWQHAHFTLDVSDTVGTGGFSLETIKQKMFKINYRVFEPNEIDHLIDIIIND